MAKKGIIILGSSRSNGNTSKIASFIKDKSNFDLIDLKTVKISQFDYDFNNQNDDFIPLMRKIVENYNLIVFATPVYWYSMSGLMKIFFDRISDCLKIEKEIGRKLRGLEMAMISCGSDLSETEGFNLPFVKSANYLGMKYLGNLHTYIEGDEIPLILKSKIKSFVDNMLKPI